MATIIDTLITKVKFETDTDGLEKGVKSVAGFAVKAAAAISAAFVGTTGLLQVINSSTREMNNLAKAVGLTTQQFQAYSQVSKQLGLDQQVVVDLVEEMNNKLGESFGLGEATTPVTEALQILGLSLKEIKDLDSAAQFQKIASAINDLPDAQKAASAADILFGGEANKFFGFLKATGKSLDEILLQYNELNFLTNRGVKGAEAYSNAFDNLNFALGSFGREIAGILGGVLVPVLEGVTDAFVGFVNFIQENQQFFIILVTILTGLAVAFGIYTGAISAASAATWAFVSAISVPIAIAAAVVAAVVAIALAVDDLITGFMGGKSVIMDFFKEFLGIDILKNFEIAKQAIVDLWEFIKSLFTAEFWSNLWDDMLQSFLNSVSGISDFFGGLLDFSGISVPSFAGFGSAGITNNRSTSVGEVTVTVNAQGATAEDIAGTIGQAMTQEMRNTAQDFDSEIQR